MSVRCDYVHETWLYFVTALSVGYLFIEEISPSHDITYEFGNREIMTKYQDLEDFDKRKVTTGYIIKYFKRLGSK